MIYVIERGWHTDIGIAVDTLTGPITALPGEFPGVRFFAIGFGERAYLLERHTTPFSMLAALLPNRSAMLVTALSAEPQAAFGADNVVALHVSAAGFEQIEAKIWQEFQHLENGRPMPLASGPYPGSVFYAAVDTYDGLFTCNTWTAHLLRAGGLPMPTEGILFAGQVMGMARWIQASQSLLRLHG